MEIKSQGASKGHGVTCLAHEVGGKYRGKLWTNVGKRLVWRLACVLWSWTAPARLQELPKNPVSTFERTSIKKRYVNTRWKTTTNLSKFPSFRTAPFHDHDQTSIHLSHFQATPAPVLCYKPITTAKISNESDFIQRYTFPIGHVPMPPSPHRTVIMSWEVFYRLWWTCP